MARIENKPMKDGFVRYRPYNILKPSKKIIRLPITSIKTENIHYTKDSLQSLQGEGFTQTLLQQQSDYGSDFKQNIQIEEDPLKMSSSNENYDTKK